MRVKLKIPTKLSEIPIGQFIALQKIYTSAKPDDVGDIEWALTQNVQAVSILTGAKEEDIWELTGPQLKNIVKRITFLTDPKWDEKVTNRITIAGKVYVANLLINELTGGQYIDLSTFLKDPVNNLHQIMATLYLPTKRNWYGKRVAIPYDGKTHEERAKLFLDHMPVSVAYPCAVFFYTVANNSQRALSDYFQTAAELKLKALNRMLLKQQQSSQRTGGGLLRWITSAITRPKSGTISST